MTPLFDPGLQPERTELAWRRTALAVGVISLVAARLLPEAFGNAWWALPGVGGVVGAGAIWLMARHRYHSVVARLNKYGDRAFLPGAWELAILAALSTAVGAAAVAVVTIMTTQSLP